MSGDVQPRKRKDKKKKKDESDAFMPSNEDLNIHIHKEGGTGGNICAKIVFFFLFSALIVLVGLIIKENQGLNQLESIESESRYSQIFEGWIDQSVDNHDDHSPEVQESHEYDEHEVDEDDDETYSESEQNNIEDDNEEEDQSQDVDEDDTNETEDNVSTPRSKEDTEEDTVLSAEISEEEEGSQEVDQNSKEVEQEEGRKTENDRSDQSGSLEEGETASTESVEHEGDADEERDDKEELKEESEAKAANLEELKPSSGDVNVGDEGDSEREVYEHSDVTNNEDYEIREDIDAALEQLHKNAAYANNMFEALLDQYPLSPRILYGKAKALDGLAEEQQSNDLLNEALIYYLRALNTPSVPDQLFIQVANRYINRARFIGQYKKAIAVHWQLIERFPGNSSFLNTLAVTYLTVNLVEEARSVLQRVLSKWPDDGFALVHYGFVLKTADNNLEASVDYLSRGLEKKAPGVVNGRFYFHLGDALVRLGKNDEAMKIYEEGVEQKVFMSIYQRSLYNVERLTAKPWWEPEDLATYEKLFSALTDNWKEIRREGLSALSDRGYFEDEAENLKDTGTWRQLELFARGQKHSKNCAKTPITCGIIQRFPYARGCRRGQTKFSVIHPGTHVWPHCGPTNCRLRVHLGLKVPPNTFIRVAKEMRSWKEGDIIIFDDSFEHEVWHNGSDFRLVLIIDVWHPELTIMEKRSLSPI